MILPDLEQLCKPGSAPGGPQPLTAALERISKRKVRLREARLGQLRYAGGNRFRLGPDDVELSRPAMEALCGMLRVPVDLLGQLGPQLGDAVLQRLQRVGRRAPGAREEVRLALNQKGVVVSLAPAGLTWLSNAAIVDAVKDAWPDKIPAETVSAARLYLDDTRFELSCYTKRRFTEPRVGDVLFGGVTIRHSQTGIEPTVILGYIHRLVCANGMTQRVCFGGKPARTKRGNSSPARTLQSIKRQVTQAWYQLGERLEGVKKLLEHPLRVDRLPDSLRRRGSVNRRIAGQINHALHNDELGRTNTEYDVVNALARVATHSQDLSPRYRRQLSLAAGMLAQRHVHLCPTCGNWLDGRPAAS